MFIDIPFKSLAFGARQKRSELLLDYCKTENELDLVLFCNPDDLYETEKNLYCNQLSVIALNNLSYSDRKYTIAGSEAKKLAQLLNKSNYDLVLIREISFYPLIDLIDFYLPDAKIILDQTNIEDFSSRKHKSKILNNPFIFNNTLKNVMGFKNVFFTFPTHRSQLLFRQHCVHFNNNLEKKMFVLANPLGASYKNKDQYQGPSYFLIYGDYTKPQNIDALYLFLKTQYLEIYQNLKNTNSYLYLVGNNISTLWENCKKTLPFTDRINPIGTVKNIQKYIVNSKCMIIPNQTQGTNLTRLFESLSQNKQVIIDPSYTELNSDLIVKATRPGDLHKILNLYMTKGHLENSSPADFETSNIMTQSFNQFILSTFNIKNISAA